VTGICLAAAALLILLDRGFVGPRWSASPSWRQQSTAADFARYDRVESSVTRVVDGDTLHLDIPDGTDRTTKVRLIGIDAPEMGFGGKEPMYFAREATTFATNLTRGKAVTVYLDQMAGSRDKYGRLLAYIAMPDGRILNEQLLADGYAYADTRFRHSHFHKYRQLEASARAVKAGLWAKVSPDRFPAWRQKSRTDAEPE
jgi:endonuclease YncB( thermonuclease family)